MAVDQKFLGALKDYIQKSRDQGKSPVAISKGVEFLYGMYAANEQMKADQAERERQFGLQERELALREKASERDKYDKPDMYEDPTTGAVWQWDSETGEWEPFNPRSQYEDLSSIEGMGEKTGEQVDITQPTTKGIGERYGPTMPSEQYGPAVPSDFQPSVQPGAEKTPEQQRLEQGQQYLEEKGLIPATVGAIPGIAKKALGLIGTGVRGLAGQERARTQALFGKGSYGINPSQWEQPRS